MKIKNLLSIAILGLALISCSDKKTRCYVCDKNESSQVADFITKNAKSSNNMSDEEMEDVITELRETGIKLYCRQILVNSNWNRNIIWEEVKIDSLEVLHPYLR